jgi:hypothetical protein
MTNKLAALAHDLRSHGYKASDEHPGYVSVIKGAREFSFGFVNGPLGYDVRRSWLDLGHEPPAHVFMIRAE